ncbi:phage lambda-related protein [Yersinia kristensenii]|nr:phage lambda-related protein [Yersinia kristensenii]
MHRPVRQRRPKVRAQPQRVKSGPHQAHILQQSAQNAQESKEAAQQAAQNAQNCRNEVEEVANNLANEVQTKAPLDSPALTGTPTAPTPDISATGGEVATAEFVKQAVSALVDSSPEALDTLNELAEALGNDPNFATTMTNALAGKQPLNPALTSLSGLVTAENKLAYFSNKNVMSLANLSAVGRVIIGQNSKSEVLEYLGALKSTNNLSEIATAGTDAQQQTRQHLGLGDAATMNVQSDIHDRTEGRLALPGPLVMERIFGRAKRSVEITGQQNFWHG